MKQKQMGLTSQITVQQNEIQLNEERIQSLQNQLEEADQARMSAEQTASRIEASTASLRSIISSKNHDIAVMERQLVEANRKLALATSFVKPEELNCEARTASEESSKVERRDESVEQDEESRLEALENFVSLVRSLSSLSSRDEAIHMRRRFRSDVNRSAVVAGHLLPLRQTTL